MRGHVSKKDDTEWARVGVRVVIGFSREWISGKGWANSGSSEGWWFMGDCFVLFIAILLWDDSDPILELLVNGQ